MSPSTESDRPVLSLYPEPICTSKLSVDLEPARTNVSYAVYISGFIFEEAVSVLHPGEYALHDLYGRRHCQCRIT